MKATAILSLLLLALLPLAPSCGEATAAEPSQGKTKKAKPDATYTGAISQWGVVDNGSIYFEVIGKNMKGEDGTIWLKAEPAKTSNTGLALKVLTIIMHYKGTVTVEGKKRGSMNGENALKAMDLLKIGNFVPGDK